MECIITVRIGWIVKANLHDIPLAIHWGEDADKFRPERFVDTEAYKWPRDACTSIDFFQCFGCNVLAVAGFSQGQRSCIGQRFAITEATCALANLIRRYEILLPTHLESKPRAEQEKEFSEWTPYVTIIPKNARVRLRRRTSKAD